MDAKLKAKWVKALRSGKYDQSNLVLYDGRNGYCCLGVLGRCLGVSGKRMLKSGSYGGGISEIRSALKGHAMRANLGQMNDSGDGFHTIARWIEKNL